MPRTGRVVVARRPHHLRHQGHNLRALFIEPEDYAYYLSVLATAKLELGCSIYGYCPLTNHSHVIANPGDDPANLGRLMKRVGQAYTERINRLEGRSGTAWNGRYRSSPIETDSYLLACSRYVDLNPVRAGIVARPEDYPWSSFRSKAGLELCPWLDEDDCYLALGATPEERARGYRDFVYDEIPEGEWEMLRSATRKGGLIGSRRFQREIEERLGVRLDRRPRGPRSRLWGARPPS